LEGAGKTNGILTLYCSRHSLKQEGYFVQIWRGGGDTLASITNKRLAFSTDRSIIVVIVVVFIIVIVC
jgi:hypothetical protein